MIITFLIITGLVVTANEVPEPTMIDNGKRYEKRAEPRYTEDGFPTIAIGEWPDDGWMPPPIHTPNEVKQILTRSRHICTYTDKGHCAR